MVRTKSILRLDSPFKYRNVYFVPFLIECDIQIILDGQVERKISILPTLIETVFFVASREVID